MFEIGDKVRITDKYPEDEHVGKVGTIFDIRKDAPWPYYLNGVAGCEDDEAQGKYFLVGEKEIEKVEVMIEKEFIFEKALLLIAKRGLQPAKNIHEDQEKRYSKWAVNMALNALREAGLDV